MTAAAPPSVFRRLLDSRFGPPAAAFLVILVAWEAGVRVFHVPSFLLPAPSVIVTGFDDVSVSRWFEHLWATLRVALLGSGDLPRVAITFLITFFPLVVSTTTGMMATPPELIELSRSLRAPAAREITQIRLPFAIPYIFSALKISITLAVIGAVVAEFVAAEKGIGYFIQFSTSFFKVPQAFAGLFVLATLSIVLFQTVGLLQRLFFAWSLPGEQR